MYAVSFGKRMSFELKFQDLKMIKDKNARNIFHPQTNKQRAPSKQNGRMIRSRLEFDTRLKSSKNNNNSCMISSKLAGAKFSTFIVA
jgi:hypothetical protein